jgi:hypothetical protein
MSIFKLWLVLTVLPNLSTFLFVMTCISGLAIAPIIAVYFDKNTKENERQCSVKTFKIWRIATPIIIMLTLMAPNKEQIMYIIGGYVTTNTAGIEKLPPNLVNAANKFLEGYTKENKP